MEDNTKDIKLIKAATSFDVHRKSDYPEVNAVIDIVFENVKVYRKAKGRRFRKPQTIKKCVTALVLDLWVASLSGINPYRYVSKNKTDYQKGTRYRKLYFNYDTFVGSLNDLIELGYIDEVKGIRFENQSRRTRIKAAAKLLDLFQNPEIGIPKLMDQYGITSVVVKEIEDVELVRLKDEDKNLIDYEDDEHTQQMRSNLEVINRFISKARVTLHITDSQYAQLREKIIAGSNDEEKLKIDFTKVNLHRVFNNSSWNDGGRFYGAWWQTIPKEFRKYIDINRKNTVEVDYSGHHIRILYAINNLQVPDDPYDIEGIDRDVQKQAMLIMLNADKQISAIGAMVKKRIKAPVKIIRALEERHKEISKHFFTGVGNALMNEDADLAEAVMLKMMKRRAVVLPVHDSFIVRNSYEKDLIEVMSEEFSAKYKQDARLKLKTTVLEEIQEQRELEIAQGIREEMQPLEFDLGEYVNKYKWYRSVWGS